MLVSPTIRKSACPHDCPSACALEVAVLPDNRIGRIGGSSENSYTAGVVCAKEQIKTNLEIMLYIESLIGHDRTDLTGRPLCQRHDIVQNEIR